MIMKTPQKNDQVQMISIQQLVPQDHLLRKIDSEEELLKIDGKTIIAPIQTGDEMNEVNDPEEVAAIKDIYLADLQAHADDYGELAIEIKEETEVSGVTIVAQYIDKNGEVMAEAEFTAEDVEEQAQLDEVNYSALKHWTS